MNSLPPDIRPTCAAGTATAGGTLLRSSCCDPAIHIRISGEPRPPKAPAPEVHNLPEVPSPTVLPVRLDSGTEEAYLNLLMPIIDELAYGWEAPDGGRPQVSKRQLEAHYQAVWENQFCLPRTGKFHPYILTRARIARANRGEEKVRVRSRYDSPVMLARIDIDQHSEKQNDRDQAKALANKILAGVPYWNNENERGVSGHILIERCGRTPARMNRLREDLHRAIGAIARAEGIQCGVELMGGFLETSQPYDENGVPDGPRTVIGKMTGSQTANLPRCQTLADVNGLAATRIPADSPIIRGILDRGLPLAAQQKAADEAARAERAEKWRKQEDFLRRLKAGEFDGEEGDEAPVPGPGSKRPRRGLCRDIPDAGEKLANARACIVRARQLMGIQKKAELLARRTEVMELAHVLYVENRLNGGERDPARDRRFNEAFEFLVRTFDDAKAGRGGAGGEPWFADDDLDQFERHLSGALSEANLEYANARLRAKEQAPLTRRKLAIIAATVAKNVEKSGGQSPAKAARRMLAYFGLSASGSTICAAMTILEHLGIFQKIREYSEGVCRAYRNLKAHWFPFLGEHQDDGPSSAAKAPAAEQRAQEPNAEGFAQDGIAPGAQFSFPSGYGDGFINLDVSRQGAAEAWAGSISDIDDENEDFRREDLISTRPQCAPTAAGAY